MRVHTSRKLKSFVPELSLTAYASGDQMGVLNEIPELFAMGGSGKLESLVIVDTDKIKTDFSVLFFSKPVAVGADNAAFNVSAVNMAEAYIGQVAVGASDYIDTANASVATKDLSLLLYNQNNAALKGASIWAVLVSNDTDTFTSADALTIKLGVELS